MNLDVHLTADVTGGELSGEHLQIVSGDPVGISIQSIPCATNGIINRDVSLWEASPGSKLVNQGLSVDCTGHVGLTGPGNDVPSR